MKVPDEVFGAAFSESRHVRWIGDFLVISDGKTSSSVLTSVAKHEQELLEKVVASKEDAKRVVEQARVDARRDAQSDEVALTAEVAEIRRKAEAARLAAFEATVKAAKERLVGVREAAVQRVPEVAKSVLGLFLPSANGER